MGFTVPSTALPLQHKKLEKVTMGLCRSEARVFVLAVVAWHWDKGS